jgi:hypothetical protein
MPSATDDRRVVSGFRLGRTPLLGPPGVAAERLPYQRE